MAPIPQREIEGEARLSSQNVAIPLRLSLFFLVGEIGGRSSDDKISCRVWQRVGNVGKPRLKMERGCAVCETRPVHNITENSARSTE